MKRLIHAFYIFLFTFALIACAPSDPKLTYQGVDAIGAVELLNRAQDASQMEVAVSKIEKHRRAGFDWGYFWQAIGQTNPLAKMTAAHRLRVLALSAEACSTNGFSHFSLQLLRIRTGFEFIFGPEKRCAQSLLPLAFDQYVSYLRSLKTSLAKKQLAELIHQQVLLGPPKEKDRALNSLTPNEWYDLAFDLAHSGEGDLLTQIAQDHQKQFGRVSFADRLVLHWLTSPGQLKEMSSKWALSDLVQMLIADPRLKTLSAEVSQRQWIDAMQVLAEQFEGEAEDAAQASAPMFLQNLKALELLPTRAAVEIDFSYQLLWHQRLLLAAEKVFRAQGTSINSVADQDPAGLWLKMRLSGYSEPASENLGNRLALTPLGEALLWKIRLRSIRDPLTLHNELENYCQWLDKSGVKMRRLNPDKFSLKALTRPGCVEMPVPTSTSANVQYYFPNEDFKTSFDSVFYSRGWNLQVAVKSFDAAFFDFTQAMKFSPLPPEPAPEEDHAIAFPILMGMRIAKPDVLVGPGTYYFVYHYVWRAAKDGRPAQTKPAQGYRGGQLNIRTREAGLSPAFVSFGGEGQKAVPQRLGGDASVSEIDWSSLDFDLRSSPGDSAVENSKPISLASPSIRVLRHLFQSGDRDANNKLRLFIEPARLIKNLNAEQKKKALRACAEGDQECWDNLTLGAAREIWSQYVENCPLSGGVPSCSSAALTVQLPKLVSNYFQAPKGAIGPVNADGPQGEAGSLKEEVMP